MATGTVKWFNSQKGFGFIAVDGGGDVFVHITGVEGQWFKTLEEGDFVRFDIEKSPKGDRAVNVRVE